MNIRNIVSMCTNCEDTQKEINKITKTAKSEIYDLKEKKFSMNKNILKAYIKELK